MTFHADSHLRDEQSFMKLCKLCWETSDVAETVTLLSEPSLSRKQIITRITKKTGKRAPKDIRGKEGCLKDRDTEKKCNSEWECMRLHPIFRLWQKEEKLSHSRVHWLEDQVFLNNFLNSCKSRRELPFRELLRLDCLDWNCLCVYSCCFRCWSLSSRACLVPILKEETGTRVYITCSVHAVMGMQRGRKHDDDEKEPKLRNYCWGTVAEKL